MPGPADAGLFVYAKDMQSLANFYASVLGLGRAHSEASLIVLASAQFQLLVHAIPEHIAAEIIITVPPEHREEAALKFFFTVPSIAQARSRAASLGGEVFSETWSGPEFIVCNACDPEGNIFQLRERRT